MHSIAAYMIRLNFSCSLNRLCVTIILRESRSSQVDFPETMTSFSALLKNLDISGVICPC